jgi:hypothetical protein
VVRFLWSQDIKTGEIETSVWLVERLKVERIIIEKEP